jgi:hypothetical protein
MEILRQRHIHVKIISSTIFRRLRFCRWLNKTDNAFCLVAASIVKSVAWLTRQSTTDHQTSVWREQIMLAPISLGFSRVESSWNVMTLGDAREGKWRGNWRMEWVSSTLHTTSEHGISSITTADAHTSAASSRLNWRPCQFKWTRSFRRKTEYGFCACAITFQTQSTCQYAG